MGRGGRRQSLQVWETSWRQTAVSGRRCSRVGKLRGVGEDGFEIILCEVRVILQDFLLGGARCQPAQDLLNRNSCVSHARPSRAHSWIDNNPGDIRVGDRIHAYNGMLPMAAEGLENAVMMS